MRAETPGRRWSRDAATVALMRAAAVVAAVAAVIGTSLISSWHLGAVAVTLAAGAVVAAAGRSPLAALGWLPGRRTFGLLLAWVVAGHLVLTWAYYYEPNLRVMDLGWYADVLANLALRGRYVSSIDQVHAIADHFDPSLAVLAPLFRWYPTPLWLQAAKILTFAACPLILLRIGDEALDDARWRWLLPTIWLVNPLPAYAMFSWFQPSMLAPPLVLLGFLYAARGATVRMLVVLTLLAGLKENMAVVWVCVGVFLMGERERRWSGVALAGVGVLVGLLAFFVVMPLFAAGAPLKQHARFGPGTLLLEKAIAVTGTFAAVGFLPALSLRALAFVLPVFGVHLVSNFAQMMSFRFHYFIVPGTVAFVGAVYGLAAATRGQGLWGRLTDRGRRWVGLALLGTLMLCNGTVPTYALQHHWPSPEGVRLIADLRSYRARLPADRVVYVSHLLGAYLVPHPELRVIDGLSRAERRPHLVLFEAGPQRRGMVARERRELRARLERDPGYRRLEAPATLAVFAFEGRAP